MTTVQEREATTVTRMENPIKRALMPLVWLIAATGVAATVAYLSSDVRPVRILIFGVVMVVSLVVAIDGVFHVARGRRDQRNK